MNAKKISFIMCCNNDYYLNEALAYLNELNIPENYEVDFVEIRGAKSMSAGYNEGMGKTDAKYKVYLHQDVFIINKNFLFDLLEVFRQDEKIGLVGMVGPPYLCRNATMWKDMRFGGFYRLNELLEKNLAHCFYPFKTGYMEMEAVDGLLMATQYDIPWREDIFKKWDFYDVSQSFEFLKAGYKVVVPGQSPEWYIHDCGAANLENYQGEAELFLKEYKEYMAPRQKESAATYWQCVKERVSIGFHGSEEEKKTLLQIVDEGGLEQ